MVTLFIGSYDFEVYDFTVSPFETCVVSVSVFSSFDEIAFPY